MKNSAFATEFFSTAKDANHVNLIDETLFSFGI